MINRHVHILVLFFVLYSLFSCKQTTENSPKQDMDMVTKVSSKKVEQLPYFNSPDFAPTWTSDSKTLNSFHKISDFAFKNQLGNTVTNKTLEGHIYVANFFFTTCPNICLQLTTNMRELQKIYAKDDMIRLLSHTVMPNVDTVEVLHEYGKRQDINPEKWYLVTGKKETIYDLAREAYFADDLYKQTNDKNRFIHTENLMLVDKKGHIRGVYKGTLPEEINRIQRHITILKNEY